jgi:hypothetical protein
MNQLFRILIATAAAIVALFGSIALILLIFNVQAPKLGAIITIATWVGVYKFIKPAKKESQSIETKYVETFHPNGMIMEKGNIVYGKKEGNWDIFNEEGEFIKTVVYDDGEEKYTRNAE